MRRAGSPGSDLRGEPTKELFVEMLVRDVELDDAILDLVDNAVDGARRSVGGRGRYDRYEVHLEVAKDRFAIRDNCGGIPEGIARDYAFRFGRPRDAQGLSHSVGQFGVGMKRALFKLGRAFKVTSVHAKWRFVLSVDVDQWKADEEHWDFALDEQKRPGEGHRFAADKQGTRIDVAPLHRGVSDKFGSPNFRSSLRERLRAAHTLALKRGLAITLNGTKLEPTELLIKSSPVLRPAYWKSSLLHPQGRVDVEIWAGVGERRPPRAGGWYVFCNDRLIMGPEQTGVTGWGENSPSLPKYHGQYAWFRGYVFMRARDASALPWNTPKTGVDGGDPVWRKVRSQMVLMMDPVVEFLDRRKDEQDAAQARPLQEALDDAPLVAVGAAKGGAAFRAPSAAPPGEKPVRISYTKPPGEYERVRRVLRARDLQVERPRDVGARTFEHYLREECAPDG